MSIALLPEYIGAPSVGGRLSAVTGAERVTLGRLLSCGFRLLCFRPVPMPSAYGAGVVGIAPFRLWGAVFWSFSCDAGDVCERCEKRPAPFPVWGDAGRNVVMARAVCLLTGSSDEHLADRLSCSDDIDAAQPVGGYLCVACRPLVEDCHPLHVKQAQRCGAVYACDHYGSVCGIDSDAVARLRVRCDV